MLLGAPPPRQFLSQLVLPVLELFKDEDARVRYYACESLYNISKVAVQTSWSSVWRIMADLPAIICHSHRRDVQHDSMLLLGWTGNRTTGLQGQGPRKRGLLAARSPAWGGAHAFSSSNNDDKYYYDYHQTCCYMTIHIIIILSMYN